MIRIFNIPKVATFTIFSLLPLLATGRDVISLFDSALENEDTGEAVIYKTIDSKELNLHIFNPAGDSTDKKTAIIWIHGGGWKSGLPSYIMPHARYFSSLGFVGIVPEYRLAGTDSNTIFDAIEDCRDAYYWVHDNADKLGIDVKNIVVAGESAGGHLAAVVGYIPDERLSGLPDQQTFPTATVLINPITDMTKISWAMQVPGLTPSETELGQSISPVNFPSSSSPPALVIHGAIDGVVPPDQAIDFSEALQSEGVQTQLRLWPGKTHAFFLYIEQFNLTDKSIIQLSLLEIEGFLQSLELNDYPTIHGHFSPVRFFIEEEGWRPIEPLTASAGILYGITGSGGSNDDGSAFSFNPHTQEFQLLDSSSEIPEPDAVSEIPSVGVDPTGILYLQSDSSIGAELHNFGGGLSGYSPVEGLVLLDGYYYGMTTYGGLTTDIDNPLTGGGMIYRYKPTEDPGPARQAYISWMETNGLLVNQYPGNNDDGDALDLLQEFTFGGNPSSEDQPIPTGTLDSSPDEFSLELPPLRAEMEAGLIVQRSDNLITWNTASGFETFSVDHPGDSTQFKVLTYVWPANYFNSGALFLRTTTELPD